MSKGKGRHGNGSGKRAISWRIVNNIETSAWLLLNKTQTLMGPPSKAFKDCSLVVVMSISPSFGMVIVLNWLSASYLCLILAGAFVEFIWFQRFFSSNWTPVLTRDWCVVGLAFKLWWVSGKWWISPSNKTWRSSQWSRYLHTSTKQNLCVLQKAEMAVGLTRCKDEGKSLSAISQELEVAE